MQNDEQSPAVASFKKQIDKVKENHKIAIQQKEKQESFKLQQKDQFFQHDTVPKRAFDTFNPTQHHRVPSKARSHQSQPEHPRRSTEQRQDLQVETFKSDTLQNQQQELLSESYTSSLEVHSNPLQVKPQPHPLSEYKNQIQFNHQVAYCY